MMGLWPALLFAIAGICLYAGLLHTLAALQRQRDAPHLLFAVMALLAAAHAVAKAGAYTAASPEALVGAVRWAVAATLLMVACLPWFTDRYLGRSHPRSAIALSAACEILAIADLVLPQGLTYSTLPVLQSYVLPWGERVTDVRVHEPWVWHFVTRGMLMLVVLHGLAACWSQRRVHRRRALSFGIALAAFVVLEGFNQAVNLSGWDLPHPGEVGFLAMILIMSHALVSEVARGERRMRQVLDEMPATIYLKDTDGRFLWVNRRFEGLVEIPAASAIGRTAAEAFAPAHASRLCSNDERVLETRRPLQYEETFSAGDGVRSYLSLKFPLLDGDGVPYAIGCVSTEITDQKKAQAEMRFLRQQAWYADRVSRLGMLNASIAHELNQPLAAMLFNSQAGLRFLARGALDETEVRQILEDIVRDSKRAGAVIAGMRSLIRKQQTPRVPLDVAAMVEEVLTLLHSETTARNVDVTTDLERGHVANVDKAQIQQVIINLAMNALEAMHEVPGHAAHLHVSVRREGIGEVRVLLRDNGPGVPEDQMDKLFEAFHTSKAQGLGMGLSICQSIVESQGGIVRAERNADGGMTFSFTLPLVEAREEAQEKSLENT